MGTDYYLIDPAAKEVCYIDRAGTHFCHAADPVLEHKVVEGWPHGPVRVVMQQCLDALKVEIDAGEYSDDPMLLMAWEWCQGRKVILLVDDHHPADEAADTFAHHAAWGRVEGWSGIR
jgi:hypothetical protein